MLVPAELGSRCGRENSYTHSQKWGFFHGSIHSTGKRMRVITRKRMPTVFDSAPESIVCFVGYRSSKRSLRFRGAIWQMDGKLGTIHELSTHKRQHLLLLVAPPSFSRPGQQMKREFAYLLLIWKIICGLYARYLDKSGWLQERQCTEYNKRRKKNAVNVDVDRKVYKPKKKWGCFQSCPTT